MFVGIRINTLSRGLATLKGNLQHKNMYAPFNMVRHFGKIINVKLPDLGEGTKEATLKEWFVEKGSKIKEFEDVCEVFTDKLVAQIPSTHAGIIKEIYFKTDDVCPVGCTLADIEVEGKGNVQEETVIDVPKETPVASIPMDTPKSYVGVEAVKETQKVGVAGGKVLATPFTRGYAKENNIDISLVKGTGKEGRVTNADIDAFKSKPEPIIVQATAPVQPPLTGITDDDQVKRISGILKGMTKTMTDSLSIPFFVYQDEYDATKLFKLRKELKEAKQKLTLLPFFIKAISQSFKKSPVMNINVNPATDKNGYIYEYVLKHDHNIAVAINSPNGLVVPVLKKVQDKSILQIHDEILLLRDKANEGKLTLEDYSGGSFAVSSVGNLGGTYFVPTILRPQGAILAIGKATKKAKYLGEVNGEHQWEPMDAINFSFSCDHRVIDGATCAKFSEDIKSLIENPQSMLLNMN